MNFNKITYGLFAACGLAMTLTACQNEADLGNAPGNYISVPVSTVITVPDGDETRTTLNENAGDLEWKWEKGDQVLAIDRYTGVRGYLTAGEPTNDGKTAPFSGTIDFEASAKTAKLTIFYVGKGVDPASINNEIKIDIENQDGKFESLVTRDVLWTGTSGSTAVDVTINPTYTVINDFVLRHMSSAGHFQLKIKDGETINNANVTITKANSGNLVSPFIYKIEKQSNGNVTFSDGGTEDGTITTKTGANGDFYITMMPYEGMSMKFVTTYNGKEYTGYLGGSEDFTFNLSAGQYLRSNSNNFGPLVIEMETDEPEETVDHSLNPLLKWAEGNLKRSGSGASATATIGSWDETGSYYQFGRNHGFNSVSEACTNYGAERSDIPSSNNIYPGTGSTSKVSTYYASTLNFSNYTNWFLIANAYDGDYRTPSRGEEWKDRAKNNGYTKDTPCPSGWRLPTIAEYKEIMPVINDKAGNTGSSAWTTLSQFKTLSDKKTKVAFRWSKYTYSSYSYLKIECLVVPSTMNSTSEIDWTDTNVITRYFKGSGYIQAHRNMWSWTSSIGTSYQYTARPLEWGYYEASVGGGQYSGVVIVNQTSNYMKYGGFYWTSDATQGVFSLIFNSSTGYNLGYYLSTYSDPIGANIRCVKDN